MVHPCSNRLERNEIVQTSAREQHVSAPHVTTKFIESPTVHRFPVRVRPSALGRMHALRHRLLKRMMMLPEPSARSSDVDSTVSAPRGKQEQAWIGYNPGQRGHLWRYTAIAPAPNWSFQLKATTPWSRLYPSLLRQSTLLSPALAYTSSIGSHVSVRCPGFVTLHSLTVQP
jgi:hypothetical protein